MAKDTRPSVAAYHGGIAKVFNARSLPLQRRNELAYHSRLMARKFRQVTYRSPPTTRFTANLCVSPGDDDAILV